VYVQSLFQFNTKFPHCSELTLDNTTQHSHFSPEANRCVSRRRKKDCDLSGFVGDRDAWLVFGNRSDPFDSFERIDAELALAGRQLEQDLDWNSMDR
jgi:hypothetical protein